MTRSVEASVTRVVTVPSRGRPGDLMDGLATGLVFSPAEQRACARRADLTSWAGRFAAKLAVVELLGGEVDAPLAEIAPLLRQVEILPSAAGPCGDDPDCPGPHAPEVRLHGLLQIRLAQQGEPGEPGEYEVRVSISHTRAVAVALAVLESTRTVNQT